MKKHITMALCIFLLIISSLSCDKGGDEILIWTDPPADTVPDYENPVFTPDLADPTVVRAKDGWFYAYGTENLWYEGVARVTPIVRSMDLVNWEYVCDAFDVKPSWKSSGGIWAPDVTLYKDIYYMYYSFSTWGDSNPGVGLATSSKPTGPFVDQGKILDAESTGVNNSIDPFFYYEGEGRNLKLYLFWGSFAGIWGVELNPDLKTFAGEKFRVAGNMFEATYIYKKGDYYYYFGSQNSCCEGPNTTYKVMMARSSSITGPYIDRDGRDISVNGVPGTLFLKGDGVKFVGPGHNAEIVVDDNGDEWFIYHAVELTEPYLPGGATRRPLMIDKIHWDDQGWPYIINDVPSTSLQTGPYFSN